MSKERNWVSVDTYTYEERWTIEDILMFDIHIPSDARNLDVVLYKNAWGTLTRGTPIRDPRDIKYHLFDRASDKILHEDFYTEDFDSPAPIWELLGYEEDPQLDFGLATTPKDKSSEYEKGDVGTVEVRYYKEQEHE